MTVSTLDQQENATRLVRSLTLTHAVLYGLGVTIGAGIYVLVGIAAGRSGMHAPLAFLAAAIAMAFSAGAFAELGTRMPVSASEAAYVKAAFRREWLSLGVGLTRCRDGHGLGGDDQRWERRVCVDFHTPSASVDNFGVGHCDGYLWHALPRFTRSHSLEL